MKKLILGLLFYGPWVYGFDFFDSDIDYWPKKIRSPSKKIQKEKTTPPKKKRKSEGHFQLEKATRSQK